MYQNQNTLTTKIEISISCRNLKDMDIMSKSDPMAVLFQKIDNSYLEIGRTEVIKNNLNPDFVKKFELDYHFEERQTMKFEIYDSDNASTKLSSHDFLGRFEFSLGQLVSKRKIEGALDDGNKSKNKSQIIIIYSQELTNCNEMLRLQMNGIKLDKKDLFGKSDPLIEIYRCNEPIKFIPHETNSLENLNNFTLIHKTKPIMNTLNPSWPEFLLKLNQLCCADKDRVIRVCCADWNSNGSQDFIGQFHTSVNHLISCQGKPKSYELINKKKALKKKNYQNSGTITVNKALIEIHHSFLEYISGGTELNFTVAIDFTGSNGDPTDFRSLHYIPRNSSPGLANQYEVAIMSVGLVIQDYDSDKMFPALGFGARIPPQNQVSHCFPITFQNDNPFCYGVDGLLNTYRSAIRSVVLYGPTNFAPSIRHIQRFAETYQDGSKYFVLLIITDGVITDLDDTIAAIVDCSFLPMSIIIVGVGTADFTEMECLDCDNGKLRSGNKIASRDIVQFVALRDFVKGNNPLSNQAALSKAVLLELPKQLTDWMKSRGLAPLPPKVVPLYPVQGDNVNPPSYPSAGVNNATAPPYPT